MKVSRTADTTDSVRRSPGTKLTDLTADDMPPTQPAFSWYLRIFFDNGPRNAEPAPPEV